MQCYSIIKEQSNANAADVQYSSIASLTRIIVSLSLSWLACLPADMNYFLLSILFDDCIHWKLQTAEDEIGARLFLGKDRPDLLSL